MHLKNLLDDLRVFKSPPLVFNPWRDCDEKCDIAKDAPQIRLRQLEKFLSLRLRAAKFILVAEAVGYQGAKFTGMPLTSERIILGKHQIKPAFVLGGEFGQRTSDPKSPLLKGAQKRFGFCEPTATIVWKEAMACKVSPLEIVTWNIFPFHPYRSLGEPLTNRTPKRSEFETGLRYLFRFIQVFPGASVISIGAHSKNILNGAKIPNFHVPHPANGGAPKFRSSISQVFGRFSR